MVEDEEEDEDEEDDGDSGLWVLTQSQNSFTLFSKNENFITIFSNFFQ